MKRIDPVSLGLRKNLIIESDSNSIAIIIDRKSRIIMKDGLKIIDYFNVLKKHFPNKQCILKTNTPVCSKTINFLKEEGINICSV